MEPFGARLASAMANRGPLCVGIDPHPALLASWGLPDSPVGLQQFVDITVAALGEQVAIFKPQSAFFERFGSAGIAVLERLLVQVRETGALVLMDAKRGDIGSTMGAYAQAYLSDGSPLASDAVTISPYLGFGSLQPALDMAAQTGRGVFVLALTSNPEGPQLQHAVQADGRMVAQAIADAAGAANAGASPMGSVGLVIGATVGVTGVDVSGVNGPLLAPGLGAQGATAEDLRTVFGSALANVVPTTSREVLSAGPSAAGLQDAAARMLEQIRQVLG
ncbi:orotidine-5'-phosphate decarboxylase [Nakamurella antarctica]|uniref:Orotidine 5'-phosphate decarboxylase n=1 Tax=Nakamurella antarctica TaxID=1902245 RepID=A0A3G9A0R4_9ACTN|nr:orotidine-5'-phosphate decarboxylase [Nakamurella antarctica]